MSDRAFDDARWPTTHEGHAECFLCGRKVDPLDPHRGSYTANASACDGLPIHLPCLEGRDMVQVMAAFMHALNTMGEANAKRQMREAACATETVQ